MEKASKKEEKREKDILFIYIYTVYLVFINCLCRQCILYIHIYSICISAVYSIYIVFFFKLSMHEFDVISLFFFPSGEVLMQINVNFVHSFNERMSLNI